jgi:hypothetical protein
MASISLGKAEIKVGNDAIFARVYSMKVYRGALDG